MVVRLPLGFYSEPSPTGVPGLHSQPVSSWLAGPGIDVELAKRNAHSAVRFWSGLLDRLPPIFPLP